MQCEFDMQEGMKARACVAAKALDQYESGTVQV
jgi:hypothetical protein